MNTTSFIKSLSISTVLFAAPAFAANVDTEGTIGTGTHATCNCKNAADCTCKKGECKCKSCGNGKKLKVFDSLKGSKETTRLPDTARYDARGGVFI